MFALFAITTLLIGSNSLSRLRQFPEPGQGTHLNNYLITYKIKLI